MEGTQAAARPPDSFSGGPAYLWATLAVPAALLILAAAASQLTASRFSALAVLATGVAAAYLVWHAEPVWVFSIAIPLSVFSGNWGGVSLPAGLAPDRFLLGLGLLAVILRAPGARRLPPIRVSGTHWVQAGALVYVVVSAFVVGSLWQSEALFRLTDRLGLLPFLVFLVAPVVFRTARERAILLGALVVVGGYLGVTALLQTIGADSLVFPKYIVDPTYGEHTGRARGPLTEPEANGIAMFGCGIAALIAATTWRRGRGVAGAVAILCAAGTLFTLARAVWVGAILATVVTLAVYAPLRRYLVPTLVGGLLIVLGAFAAVPGLRDRAEQRKNDKTPVYDRRNLSRAALNMIAERPLIGFGWQQFPVASQDHFEQGDTYPLTGTSEVVHNAFLSNAVELGLLGTGLWVLGLLSAIGGALATRGPPDLEPWRMGLLAYALMWGVVANLTPLERPFTILLLMGWAGVVWSGRYRSGRPADLSPRPS